MAGEWSSQTVLQKQMTMAPEKAEPGSKMGPTQGSWPCNYPQRCGLSLLWSLAQRTASSKVNLHGTTALTPEFTPPDNPTLWEVSFEKYRHIYPLVEYCLRISRFLLKSRCKSTVWMLVAGPHANFSWVCPFRCSSWKSQAIVKSFVLTCHTKSRAKPTSLCPACILHPCVCFCPSSQVAP